MTFLMGYGLNWIWVKLIGLDLTGVAASLMIEKLTPDLLRLSTTFYELSVVCNHVSKSERRQFGASGSQRI